MVYFGGRVVANRVASSGNIYYYEEDMLGSSRTMVQAGATAVCYDADFEPFGGERAIVNTCSQNYKFEGKKRDPETRNDDFGARFYRSNLGRWMSADWSSVPAPVPYANLTNPQTLNLYAMVADNPETFADLDGHTCTYGPSGQENCKDTANSNANAPATTGEGHSQPDPQKTGDGQPPLSPAQLAAEVPQNVKDAILASVDASNHKTADDKHGGFHEEGGQWGTDASGNVVVSPSKPGPYAAPGGTPTEGLHPVDSKQNAKFVSFGGEWHVHPGGTSLGLDGTVHYFVQPPSAVDKAAATPGLNIVVGAGNKTVYFYNSSKVIGQMSLKTFMRSPQ